MKKPLKVAAWAGIISVVISIISLPVTIALGETIAGSVVSSLVGLVSGVLGIFFMYGFVVLGRRFDAKLLKVMAWIGIVASSVLIVIMLVGSIVGMMGVASAQEFDILNLNEGDIENMSEAELQSLGMMLIGMFLAFWIFISIVVGAYYVLFGVGLLKLQGKVPYAKVTGILDIVAGATFVIFVGFVLMFVSFVFKLVMLFETSRKFEKGKF